jgi:hypothetical protein
MALPVILVSSSAPGSDTAASGAGPATAVTGTSAAHTGGSASTTITLTNSPDLSGVSTLGDAVLYLAISTAGVKNFTKITGVDNSAKTVTVADSFTIASGSAVNYAIGGKRASIGSATSKKLRDNNGAAGDAMPGWVIEMESAHAETLTEALDFRRAGDLTSGPIVLRGAYGAATRPILTFSADTSGCIPRVDYIQLVDFDLVSSAAKGGASSGVNAGASGLSLVCRGLKITTSGANAWQFGIYNISNATMIANCEVGHAVVSGIHAVGCLGLEVLDSYIHECGTLGINLTNGTYAGLAIYANIIANNGTTSSHHGILIDQARTDGYGRCTVKHNTLVDNAGDGFNWNQWSGSLACMTIANNLFRGNRYGINFSNASATPAGVWAYGVQLLGNAYASNTSGESVANTVALVGEIGKVSSVTLDNASFDSGGNYLLGASSTAKAAGYPTTNLGWSATRSYVDIGAAQREEPTGGAGGLLRTPGMSGGIGG